MKEVKETEAEEEEEEEEGEDEEGEEGEEEREVEEEEEEEEGGCNAVVEQEEALVLRYPRLSRTNIIKNGWRAQTWLRLCQARSATSLVNGWPLYHASAGKRPAIRLWSYTREELKKRRC